MPNYGFNWQNAPLGIHRVHSHTTLSSGAVDSPPVDIAVATPGLSIMGWSRDSEGMPQVTLGIPPKVTYTVESTKNLSDWQPYWIVQSPSGLVNFAPRFDQS